MSETESDRRDFLKVTAAVATVAAVLPKAGAAPAEQAPNETGPFDVVISGGRAINPERGLDAVRHVGIKGSRIAAVSDKPLQGAKELKADGQVVAPGFIDLHSHAIEMPGACMQAFDGVTTALELESRLLPVGMAYDRIAKEGRPINHGLGVAWTFARIVTLQPEAGKPDGTPGWVQKAFSLSGRQNAIPDKAQLDRIIDLVESGLGEVSTYTHDRYLSVLEPQSSFEALGEQIGLAAITGARTSPGRASRASAWGSWPSRPDTSALGRRRIPWVASSSSRSSGAGTRRAS